MSKEQRANLVLSAALTFVVLLVYGGSVGLLWWLGVFDVPETEAGSRVVAAAIALVGGLFAALLTFVGVLLKYSLDARTVDLKSDAEDRLKLETFIRAVGLLSTDTGGETTRSQHAGTLFALAELGHLRFALALLEEMWPEGDVSSSSACWLIDRCLQSTDKHVQIQAAQILFANADKLTERTDDFQWPELLMKSWPTKLPTTARGRILIALGLSIKSRSRGEGGIGILISQIFILDWIRCGDPDPGIQGGAVLFLHALDAFISQAPWFRLGNRELDPKSLNSDVADSLPSAKESADHEMTAISKELRTWTADQLKVWNLGTKDS